MKCGKVKKKLLDYIDGNVSKADSAFIQDHISECNSCRRELESYSKLSGLIDSVNKIDYPPESVWKNFIFDLHTRIEKEALCEYVEKQKRPSYMKWSWVSIAVASVLFFIFSLALEYRPSATPEQNQQIKDVQRSVTSAITEKSEGLSIAEVISKTFIDEKEAKELKKLDKIVDYDIFAPSSYNSYMIISDTNAKSETADNNVIKTLLDEDLSEYDSYDSTEYYTSVTGRM